MVWCQFEIRLTVEKTDITEQLSWRMTRACRTQFILGNVSLERNFMFSTSSDGNSTVDEKWELTGCIKDRFTFFQVYLKTTLPSPHCNSFAAVIFPPVYWLRNDPFLMHFQCTRSGIKSAVLVTSKNALYIPAEAYVRLQPSELDKSSEYLPKPQSLFSLFVSSQWFFAKPQWRGAGIFEHDGERLNFFYSSQHCCVTKLTRGLCLTVI